MGVFFFFFSFSPPLQVPHVDGQGRGSRGEQEEGKRCLISFAFPACVEPPSPASHRPPLLFFLPGLPRAERVRKQALFPQARPPPSVRSRTHRTCSRPDLHRTTCHCTNHRETRKKTCASTARSRASPLIPHAAARLGAHAVKKGRRRRKGKGTEGGREAGGGRMPRGRAVYACAVSVEGLCIFVNTLAHVRHMRARAASRDQTLALNTPSPAAPSQHPTPTQAHLLDAKAQVVLLLDGEGARGVGMRGKI